MVPILDWVAKEPSNARENEWRKDTKDLKGWKKNNHCRTKKRWVFKQKEPLFKTSVLIGEKLSTIAVYKFISNFDISKQIHFGAYQKPSKTLLL